MTEIREFFETVLPQKLKNDPSLVSSIASKYQFSLGDAGDWVVDLTQEGGDVHEGRDETAQCVVTCSGDSLAKLLTNPQSATMMFMTGKLKVSNLSLGMQLQKLLG